jgi:hypothetical protein
MSASVELYLGVDIPLMEELGTLGRPPDDQDSNSRGSSNLQLSGSRCAPKLSEAID